jgi:hypothetical protein
MIQFELYCVSSLREKKILVICELFFYAQVKLTRPATDQHKLAQSSSVSYIMSPP